MPPQNYKISATSATFENWVSGVKLLALIEMSLQYIANSPININPSLVYILAWHQASDGLFTNAHMRHCLDG